MADERMHATLQENIITILCHSDEHGGQVSRSLKAELMEGDYRTIAEKAIAYWLKWERAPGDHTIDLIADILKDPHNRRAKSFQRILSSMEILAPNINAKFVLEQVRQFTRMQRLKDAILKSAEQLNARAELAIGEVEDIWNALLRENDVAFDQGMGLNDVDRLLDYLDSHNTEFSTGIPQLDRRGIVPSRGTVMLLLAPTGRGKSWWLCHLGKKAIEQRKRVLHITLEMSEEEVVMRYYQAFFAVAKRNRKANITTLVTDGADDGSDSDNPIAERLHALERETIQPEWTFNHPHIRDELIVHMGHFGRRFENVIIKRFGGRSLSMNGLRAYLDMLHQTQNFVPDLLVLDYIGITKTDMKEHRLSLGHNLEDFRTIMVERNMAGVTVQQVGRLGMKAANVRAIHAAEDISLINTSDIAITYSATDAEHELGLARLFVDKARHEQDKFGLLITQNYAMGQFVLESILLDNEYAALLRGLTGEKDDDGEADEDDRDDKRRDK